MALSDVSGGQQAAASPPGSSRAEVMTRLFGYIRGLHATYVMDVGVQLGLFTALAAVPQEPDQLAAALGLHHFYVRKWCETAYSLELLEWRERQGYRLGPHIADLLANPEHTYYMGGFPSIHLRVAEDYADYAQRFRDGGTKPYQAHDEAFFGAVADGLRTLPLMLLDVLAAELPRVQEKLQAGGHLLDVGCGAGAAVCEFAARFPALHCLGVDVEPQSLQLARNAIAARSLG
ncbi:MAG: SAM-dependent methyltransferase, partial [Chloroflexota bacterium]